MSFGSVDRFMGESTREQKEERTRKDNESWIEKNNRKLAMGIQEGRKLELEKFRDDIENKAFRAGYMAGLKDGLDVAKDE